MNKKKFCIISLIIVGMVLGISLYKNHQQHQDLIGGIMLQYLDNQKRIFDTLERALETREETGDYEFLLHISRAQGINDSNILLLGNATNIGSHLMYEGIDVPRIIIDLNSMGGSAMFIVYENTFNNKLTEGDIKGLEDYMENLDLILSEFKYDGKSTDVFEKSPKELAEKMNKVSKELQVSLK
ncbi:hypothetical protein ACJ2A9_16955 [Anaerobacillus sp. MEB173]|uniref:hypothetical protein n=1 Tax=Anaerobacillus sp. MEB173 TaxID=3383345 RepID=UPI003F91FC3E